jgi:pimeloyl-ACP methyl ester carboxylesterase
MPIADLNGITIYYETTGRGRPLVFAHGFACGAAMWEPQVRAFGGRYRVVTYDVRGHGASTAPTDPAAYSQQASVEDLYQLMLRLGIRDACLCGLSMGGGIAIDFALAHPELLAGLVVADTGSGSAGDPEVRRAAVARRLAALERGIEAGADHLIAEPIFATCAAMGPEAARHLRSLLTTHRAHGLIGTLDGLERTRRTPYQLESELKSLALPTLIVVGERDESCLAPSRFLADTIPSARLATIRGVGHMSNLEDPTTFNARLDEFLLHLWSA